VLFLGLYSILNGEFIIPKQEIRIEICVDSYRE
jgi:hypothetical protein